MIHLADCKDRYLYKINSRNLSFGVFRAKSKGFLGLRTKFNSTFIFEEYHWDNGPPYGTVKPEECLVELPTEIHLEVDLGTICYNCNKLCSYVLFPDGDREIKYEDGSTQMVHGSWQHLEPTSCNKIDPVSNNNKLLYNWLSEIEGQFRSSK